MVIHRRLHRGPTVASRLLQKQFIMLMSAAFFDEFDCRARVFKENLILLRSEGVIFFIIDNAVAYRYRRIISA